MTRFDPEHLEVASLCDIGRQRTSNQDACGEVRSAAGARLLVVADGMGGHAGGETASRLAVETICAAIAGSRQAPGEALRAAFEAANRAVHAAAQRDARLAGMGTTGVALCFSPDGAAYVANVGDSRAYRLRAGRLEQISSDHSLVAELQRRGLLTAEEALVHPRRNEVLRSLGVEPDVQVDLHELACAAGDVFLLCSDGLSGRSRDAEIAELLARDVAVEAARGLVELANRRGGPDNVTVQVARIPAPERESSAASGGGPAPRQLPVWLLACAMAASLLALALWWGPA